MRKEKKELTSRDLQAIETKSKIIEVSKMLFANNSFNGTTIRQISKEVGMADGLIYHYFPDGKKGILNFILDEFVTERSEKIEEELLVLGKIQSIKEILEFLGNTIFKYFGKDKNLLIILMREQSTFDEIHMRRFHKNIKKIVIKTLKIIKNKINEEQIKSFDVLMMANQFWSSIYSFIIQNALFQNNNFYSYSKEEYLKLIIDHTLKTWQK